VEAKAVAKMQERRLKIGTERAGLEDHRKEGKRKKKGENWKNWRKLERKGKK
jgi:hypothetical protein